MNECKPLRVLVVEDEFLISETVRDALEDQGFAVQTAVNAGDALELLMLRPFDILFTDINLPGGMDGVTLARRARELCPRLAVVYASGGMRAPSVDARVPDSIFVPKPYLPNAIGKLLCAAATRTVERALA